MSAPIKLDSIQLNHLAQALNELSKITHDHGIRFDVYGPANIAIDGQIIRISYDDRIHGAYVVDDRIGD